MKTLRILTGVHAGARLQLRSSAYRVGSAQDADIHISDWPVAESLLSVGSHDEVSLSCPVLSKADDTHSMHEAHNGDDASCTETAAINEVILLPDFVPFKYGDILICVGDDQQTWPGDVELLGKLWADSPKPARGLLSRRRWVAYGVSGLLLVALSTSIALLSDSQDGEAAQARNGRALATKVREALGSAKLSELKVASKGAVVVVSGMVATPADDTAARSIFSHLARRSGTIERQYDIAANVAQEIEDAVGTPGVHAQYLGHGVFRITGKVTDMAHARDALDRLGPDFDSNVTRIDNQLTQSPDAAVATRYSELISDGPVKYLQTPDGVKHIYMDGGK